MISTGIPLSRALARRIAGVAAVAVALAFSLVIFFLDDISKMGTYGRISFFASLYLLVAVTIRKSTRAAIRRHVTDPLAKLSSVTGDVMAGNYSTRADITAENEIGELSSRLNFMIDIIARHTNELEERVDSQKAEMGRMASRQKSLSAKIAELDGYAERLDRVLSTDRLTCAMAALNFLECLIAGLVEDEFPNKAYYSEQAGRLSTAVRAASARAAADIARNESALNVISSECDFTAIVASAIELLRPLSELKKIGVRREIARDLSVVFIDTEKAATAVASIFANAVRHTAPGGTITVTAAFEEETVSFSIVSSPCENREGGQRGTMGETSFPESIEACRILIERHGGQLFSESRNDGHAKTGFRITQKNPE